MNKRKAQNLLLSLFTFLLSVTICISISSEIASATAQVEYELIDVGIQYQTEAMKEAAEKEKMQKETEEKEAAEAAQKAKEAEEKEKEEIEEEKTEEDVSGNGYHTISNVKLTAYCACDKCCNTGATVKHTASGTIPKQGRTVAVDPSVIPLGSTVIINGYSFIAEDTGGAIDGNRIDVFFTNHQDAINFGVQYADVIWY